MLMWTQLSEAKGSVDMRSAVWRGVSCEVSISSVVSFATVAGQPQANA